MLKAMGGYGLMQSALRLGSAGLGFMLLNSYEPSSDLPSFTELQCPLLQSGSNNAKIFCDSQIHT